MMPNNTTTTPPVEFIAWRAPGGPTHLIPEAKPYPPKARCGTSVRLNWQPVDEDDDPNPFCKKCLPPTTDLGTCDYCEKPLRKNHFNQFADPEGGCDLALCDECEPLKTHERPA